MAKTIENIDPSTAENLRNDNPDAVVIDVRSKVEFDYVGHPLGAVHVAWKDYPGWQEEPAFCERVDDALKQHGGDNKDRPLLILCRSGVRSRDAGQKLLDYGYTNVVNVAGGFEGDKDDNNHRGNINGWRFHGLPWEQT